MPDTGRATASSQGGNTPRSRRTIRFWHVLTMIAVVSVGAVLVMRWHWQREFRRRVAAIAAAGYPVTPEEIDARYKWPESGENAADWILDAAACLTEPPEEDYRNLQRIVGYRGELLSPREPLPEDVKKLLVQHVRGNAKALELLHGAAAIKEGRYPVDFSQRLGGVLMLHIPDVRKGCLLLCFEAVLCGQEGDAEGAARATEAAFQVARTLAAEPAQVSQLVRFAGQRNAVVALERILCEIELTDTQLHRLEMAVSDADEPDALASCLAGDRCMFLDLFERPELLDADISDYFHLPRPALLEAYKALGLAAREGIIYLEMMGECIEAVRLPTFRRRAALDAVEARFHARRRRCVLLTQVNASGPAVTIEIECLAYLRTALAALVVERYRLDRGHLPDTLAELVPDFLERVPEDPFDGAPLRYQRLDRGFVVYSVGQDGDADGGLEPPPSEKHAPNETYDITFTVPR